MTIPISKGKGRLTAQVTPSSTTISFTGTDSNRSLESVTMSDFGSAGYLIINPGGNVGNYEIVKFTSWSVSGSVITIGGLTRNLQLQGSDVAQTGLSFASTTTVIVGDNHHWWNQIANTGVQATTGVAGTVEIATDNENATSATTGGSGAIVVAAASSHTTTPTASKIPVADANGVLDQGWTDILLTAGEAIDTTTTPLAIYIKNSDGKAYKTTTTSITSEAAWNFKGFALYGQNISVGNSVKVRIRGRVPSFTGLTTGTAYFLNTTAGTLTSTSGTLMVGFAISTTELYIEKSQPCYATTTTFSSTATTAITCGFRPVRIDIYAGAGANKFSIGGFDYNGGDKCLGISAASYGVFSYSWYVTDGAGNFHAGTVTNITNTGFTLDNTKTGTPGNCQMAVRIFGSLM